MSCQWSLSVPPENIGKPKAWGIERDHWHGQRSILVASLLADFGICVANRGNN